MYNNMNTFDATELALKICSCIYRAEEKYGAHLIASTLCGAQSRKIKEFELDKLSTYDIVQDLSIKQVIAVIHYLMHLGLLYRSTEHNNIRLARKGKQFLKEKITLLIPQKIIDDAKSPLFTQKLLHTHYETFKHWQNGLSISAIAKLRNLKETTIEEHLADLIYNQKILDISSLVPKEIEELIASIIDKSQGEKLRIIKDQLPQDISYGQIKMVLARHYDE